MQRGDSINHHNILQPDYFLAQKLFKPQTKLALSYYPSSKITDDATLIATSILRAAQLAAKDNNIPEARRLYQLALPRTRNEVAYDIERYLEQTDQNPDCIIS